MLTAVAVSVSVSHIYERVSLLVSFKAEIGTGEYVSRSRYMNE